MFFTPFIMKPLRCLLESESGKVFPALRHPNTEHCTVFGRPETGSSHHTCRAARVLTYLSVNCTIYITLHYR